MFLYCGDGSEKAPNFEQAVEQLEALIDQIESGEIGLDDALKRYEDGTKLIQRCRGILDTAREEDRGVECGW